MKVLVVGGGGREHALAWKISQSPLVDEVFCAPGNAGTETLATSLSVAADDLEGIAAAARRVDAGLVVVGPEGPLCAGVVDRLAAAGIPAFGPTRAAAEIEGSKAFAKDLMARAGVQTAGYRVFTDEDLAVAYLEGEVAYPVVVKASGLAGGKGAIVCEGRDEAVAAVHAMLAERRFGAGGETVVIEDFLAGEEVSMHCITDGRTFLTLPTSQDHKRAEDGDRGPNTGGMGVVSPAPRLDARGIMDVERNVVFPVLHAMNQQKRRFSGVLYTGLMVTRTGSKVLEFNARFGDPETQAILPRLKGDLVQIMLACVRGELDGVDPEALCWDPRAAVTVVIAAPGYPGKPKLGDPISGVEAAASAPDVLVFHGGTAKVAGRLVTAGGRVLSVTGLAPTVAEARQRAYAAVERVSFPGMAFRRDIGIRALEARARPSAR